MREGKDAAILFLMLEFDSKLYIKFARKVHDL